MIATYSPSEVASKASAQDASASPQHDTAGLSGCFKSWFYINLFCMRWRNRRVSGRMPSRLRTEREQRAGQAAEEVGFGTCRGERKANAAGGLDDPGGDFQETKTQRRELGKADVEAEHRRLNTGDGAPFAIPGLCLVARLGIAAQNRQVLDGASRADVVGDLVDFSGERLGTGETEDVVVAVVLAPRHRPVPSIPHVP